MSPNLRIAYRFLTAKKRAMLMSLSCIVLGVGLFIVTQATTKGFEEFFIRTILGTRGAIVIEDEIQDTLRSMTAGGPGSSFAVQQKEGRKYIQGIREPKRLIEALEQFPSVLAVSEVITGNLTMKGALQESSVKLYGINLEDHMRVSELGHQVVRGDLNEFRASPSAAILGREMAQRLQLDLGDSFILEAAGQSRRYRVSALYETGVSDIDRVALYLNLSEARSLLQRPTGASYLQVNLADKDRAPAEAERMAAVLGHSAKSWQERERSWLQAFAALSYSSAITVSVFTLIAGLAMFNTLAMLVMEKTKEIAILRSMGYTREDISQIFLWQAGIVLTIGCVLGMGFGAGVTYAVSKVPISISGIFKTETFVVSWNHWHYVAAALTAIAMVMVASLIPARRAARLEPGDVIRGTAQ